MEVKNIKELMAAMKNTGTIRCEWSDTDGTKVVLEREGTAYKVIEPSIDYMEDNPMKQEMAIHRANMMLSRGGEMPSAIYNSTTPAKSAEAVLPGSYVTSPMVGTFYSSPSPDDHSFVKVGDRIEKDTVVGIVEAMKVMNEIKAGVAGTLSEILVPTGQPVEFGTKLFRIT